MCGIGILSVDYNEYDKKINTLDVIDGHQCKNAQMTLTQVVLQKTPRYQSDNPTVTTLHKDHYRLLSGNIIDDKGNHADKSIHINYDIDFKRL